MPRFRNVSPSGALEVPALRVVVESGEELHTDDLDLADQLCDQPRNWEPVDYTRRPEAEPTSEQVMPPASAPSLEELIAGDGSEL